MHLWYIRGIQDNDFIGLKKYVSCPSQTWKPLDLKVKHTNKYKPDVVLQNIEFIDFFGDVLHIHLQL